MTSESLPKDGRTEDGIPADASAPPALPAPSAPRVARRHLDLDWEREPAQGVDPEDSLRGGGDNLARLLADVPPHHVD